MKKVFTLTFACCIASSLFGQITRQHPFIKNPAVGQSAVVKEVTTASHAFRTAAATKQRLDSILAPEAWLSRFFYNTSNEMTSDIDYVWNPTTKKWTPDWKSEFSYDAKGTIIMESNYKWDTGTSAWIGNYKQEHTFNANGEEVLGIYYDWSDTKKGWVLDAKYERTYNSNHDLTTENIYYIDNATDTWKLNAKNEYTYDINKRISQFMISDWDGANWNINQKTDYIYDAAGNTLQSTNSFRSGSQWTFSTKREYTYDAKGNMTQQLYSSWNTDVWNVSSKQVNTYDLNGNITNSNNYQWDGTALTEHDKEESTYDANSNLTMDSYYDWDKTTGNWKGSSYYTYSTNNAVPIADLFVPVDFDELFKSKLLTLSEYSIVSGSWKLLNTGTAYYSPEIVTSIDDSDVNNTGILNAYPNPANGKFNVVAVQGSTLQVYNISGQIVYEALSTDAQTAIDLTVEPKGVYFVRVNTEDQHSLIKIVIE